MEMNNCVLSTLKQIIAAGVEVGEFFKEDNRAKWEKKQTQITK